MEAHRVVHPPALAQRATSGSALLPEHRVVSPLARAARALTGDLALGPALSVIAASAVEALGAQRCLVYLRDPESGELVGTVAHGGRPGDPTPKWIGGARISTDVPGLAAALRGGKPVEIPLPVVSDGPPRSAPHLRRVLLAPIPRGEATVGALVFDRAVLRAGTSEGASAFAALAGAAVAHARRQQDAERRHHVLTLSARDQQRMAALEDELLRCAAADTDPAAVARLLAVRLEVPCALALEGERPIAYDAGGAPTRPPSLLDPAVRSRAKVRDALAQLHETGHGTIAPVTDDKHYLVAAVPSGGLLVLSARGRGLGAAETRLAQRAAAVVAIQLSGRRRHADAVAQAVEAVVRDAVHGSDNLGSLRCRAAELGLELEPATVVCLLTAPGPEVRRAVARLGLRRCRHFAETPHGVVAIAALDSASPRHAGVEAIRGELRDLLAGLPADADSPPIAAVSSVCRSADELPAALGECIQIRSWVAPTDEQDARPAVLCADDLGAAKLLLGRISPAAAERFADGVLGPLGEGEEGAKLLETLEAFFAANHFIRATAARLGIHENTVRYRFRKLAQATGLDLLGSADDQLTARLALTMRALRGKATTTKEPA